MRTTSTIRCSGMACWSDSNVNVAGRIESMLSLSYRSLVDSMNAFAGEGVKSPHPSCSTSISSIDPLTLPSGACDPEAGGMPAGGGKVEGPDTEGSRDRTGVLPLREDDDLGTSVIWPGPGPRINVSLALFHRHASMGT